MEWVYRILVLLGVGIGGFFVGKFFYDKPIDPPKPITQVDTTTVYETKIDTIYEDNYIVLKDTTILMDTVYIDVKVAENIYETTFEMDAMLFSAKISLTSTRPIRPFLLEDPKMTYKLKPEYNKKITESFESGYKLGYMTGFEVGGQKTDIKNMLISGGVGLLVGTIAGGIAF